ncbi:MAG: CPBP family intramembrane metalloprotease [Gammaproteobacteria bacterium]|nr:CPBP family intramembrane metalloprotease [Gammaproteobacteria bacterium]MBV9727269.1 CPBP family intramembrane metalloprotease [Gammaproteobacteria bacterium]
MRATDTTASPQRHLPAALRWMPVQLVLLFVLLTAIDIACQLLRVWLVRIAPPGLGDIAWLLGALILSVAMIGAYRRLVGALEQRRADELATGLALRGLSGGALAGAALFGLVYLVLWAAGAASSGGFSGFGGAGRALGVAIESAIGEEILFRGVLFRHLESAFGTTLALALSALAFGLVHAGNAGASWISTLAIALESGVLLGVAYAATRSLWLPIGLHFGWNFTEGGIFGAAVSGGQYQGLIPLQLSGPPWLTGGAFGPEASLPALLIALGASAALGWYAVRRGTWQPPGWRLRAVRP